MTAIEKNVVGLDGVLTRMTQRMSLANYAESTMASYSRSVRVLGEKVGKSLEIIE